MPASRTTFLRISSALATLAMATLVALFAGAGPASAATVTQQTAQACDTYANGTDWFTATADVQLPKFNPALGSLVSARVTATSAIASTMKVESRDSAQRTDVFNLERASAWIEGPGVGRLTSSLPPQQKSRTFTPFDGVVDYAGSSGWTSSFGDDSQQAIVDVTDLASWTGPGNVTLDAEARATTTNTLSGNFVLDWSTDANVSACVVYTYTEEVLVCIGDYVWNDVDKDGVQDAGEAGLPGRPVTVTVDGATFTTTTDASGRWTVCNLEPQRPCVVSVDLPDGWTLTIANQGGDDAADSDGRPNGGDATIDCATPPRGSDLTFDVGVHQNPAVVVPPPVQPAPQPAAAQPGAAPGPAPAVLRVGKRSTAAVVRSGGTAKFLVTVRNRGSQAIRNITVCDTPPRLLAFASTPRGSFFRAGKLCWNIASLRAGQTRTFSYTMRASSVARRSCVSNSVTAAAVAGGTATARAGLCIRPTRLRALPLAG